MAYMDQDDANRHLILLGSKKSSVQSPVNKRDREDRICGNTEREENFLLGFAAM